MSISQYATMEKASFTSTHRNDSCELVHNNVSVKHDKTTPLLKGAPIVSSNDNSEKVCCLADSLGSKYDNSNKQENTKLSQSLFEFQVHVFEQTAESDR